MLNAQLEVEDYYSAQKLHNRLTLKKFGIIAILFVPVLVLGLAVLWKEYDFLGSGVNGSSVAGIIGGVAGGIIGGVAGAAFVGRVYVRWHLRRVFRQQKSLHEPFSFEWNPDGLTTQSERGQITMKWADFTKWKENERLFLLYHSDLVFQVVPKKSFPDADAIESFRSQLKNTIRASS